MSVRFYPLNIEKIPPSAIVECSICLKPVHEDTQQWVAHNSFEPEEQLFHEVHKDCIVEWLQNEWLDSSKTTCPVCRVAVETASLGVQLLSRKQAFIKAAKEGNTPSLKHLWAADDEREIDRDTCIDAFQEAVKNGQVEMVRYFFESEDFEEEVDLPFELALHSAASDGDLEMIQCLLEYEKQYELLPKDLFETALDDAAANGHLKVVEYFLNSSRKFSQRSLQRAYKHAKKREQEEVMRLLENFQHKRSQCNRLSEEEPLIKRRRLESIS